MVATPVVVVLGSGVAVAAKVVVVVVLGSGEAVAAVAAVVAVSKPVIWCSEPSRLQRIRKQTIFFLNINA